MTWTAIQKPRESWTVTPNLSDCARARAECSWASARRVLDGLPGGRGLNIADDAVDRHASGPQGGVAREFAPDSLRFVSSVAEPLNPEAVVWGQKAFGQPRHDNWCGLPEGDLSTLEEEPR